MSEKKYTPQMKHIKEHYTQFKMNLRPDLLESFKRKCAENGTTPTTEIKKFIMDYCTEEKDTQ